MSINVSVSLLITLTFVRLVSLKKMGDGISVWKKSMCFSTVVCLSWVLLMITYHITNSGGEKIVQCNLHVGTFIFTTSTVSISK